MDSSLIKKALCFHGKPMQKIWDDERGAGDLQLIGVPEDGNYNVYMDRQKYFTFQDRAKRLKLHQFLARKAVDLYDKDLSKSLINSMKSKEDLDKAKQFVAEVPPYELYIVKNKDKVKRHILESIKPGDIIYATVARSKLPATSMLSLKLVVFPVCTGEPSFKFLIDYKLKALIPSHLCDSICQDKALKSRSGDSFEYLRCEVIEFSIDADRLSLSLLPTSSKNKDIKLGLIPYEEMPQLYRKLTEKCLEKYDECLKKAKEYENPNYEVLYTFNGLDVNDNFSLMTNLKYDFPPQEYAKELRQVQASKWAFRSVAEGIEYFKVGQHVEAFQCLNKALNIDPRNVEGLVARGALYANKGSFLKAVEDFEKALKLNAYHVNARKYMGETLVALGRSYEEDNRVQEAAKAYRDCLNIIPNHEQARLSLEAIQHRTGATFERIVTSPMPPAPSISDISLQQQLHDFENQITAIHSSSNEDDSSDGSSGSESDGPEGHKESSLSPLSKKLAIHRASMDSIQKSQAHYNQSFFQTSQKRASNFSVIPNEFKLDDDDTESRVHKLLHKAMKHKKEKKKSKKSKKLKKSKKDNKSPKNPVSLLEKINFQEAYNILGGGLKIESTLNSNLKMYEQTIQEIRKRQEILHQSTSTETSTSAAALNKGQRQRSETPPPPPLKPILPTPSTYVYKSINFSKNNYAATSKAVPVVEQPKFSFQIKKPVKVDKFGLIRLATPAIQNSPTPSPPRTRTFSRSPRLRERSRTRSRSRARADSGNKRRRTRSRSRSRGYNRGRAHYRRHRSSSSFSRSRSRSNSRFRGHRRISRDRSSGSRTASRRSPSPFVPRGTPSPNTRYRRSRSPRFNRRSPPRFSRSPRRSAPAPKFGNRTWQRPDFKPRVPAAAPAATSSDGKWLHDKFEDKSDGPSIEEIDEIISKAQKERKQDIINRDKNILKKTNNW